MFCQKFQPIKFSNRDYCACTQHARPHGSSPRARGVWPGSWSVAAFWRRGHKQLEGAGVSSDDESQARPPCFLEGGRGVLVGRGGVALALRVATKMAGAGELGLADLPSDPLLLILSYLDFRELLRYKEPLCVSPGELCSTCVLLGYASPTALCNVQPVCPSPGQLISSLHHDRL